MPHKHYKQTTDHKTKISNSIKNYIDRYGHFRTGKKHTETSKQKMRGPHSIAHRHKLLEASKKRWSLYYGKIIAENQWVVKPKQPEEPVGPISYNDIFMVSEGWEGIKDIL